ncbi:MAG TPA: alkaline phosphatase PhoX [Sulfuricaulis sp.]|nr:alkaline phosphatase PhoX [Sulfuricaulis sp.]
MKHVPLLKPCVFAVVMATTLAPFAAQADESDFGIQVEKLLKEQSEKLFGVEKPLGASAPATVGAYRTPSQSAYDQVLAANGLKLEYLTREAANATDMMAFYPAQNPTHLVTCIEGGRQFLIDGGTPGVYDAGDKLNPSVQRINLATGAVETILRGMSSCDGIRTTAWGTVLATEERTDGGAYEIFNPLGVSEQTVIDRASGAVTDPANITKRTALPIIAWEGIAILPNGVVIAGDELRPGSPANADGGAIFKFVPAMPRLVAGPIANLSESPLAAGSVFAMQVSCVSNTQQYGQGCEIGNAAWVAVNAATARTDANTAGATGYYRPEDLHQDPMYKDEANPEAVRFCWTNTGNEDGKNYAEVMCGVDNAPLTASNTQRSVAVNRFVEGDTDFNSFDNLEFQPKTGNVYVIEDHDNGDIFACLPDGMDRDIKTDGCVKILSVKDSSAEPTGFLFDASGTTAYVSIQHSDDTNMPLVDGYRTDDVLKITGFKLKKQGWGW